MPRLIVTAGPDAGRSFAVSAPASVGRQAANAVHLHDGRVSRRHFEITAADGVYTLTDLVSGNGTRVNGRPVQAVELRPGDRIEVGDTVLQFAADPPAERPGVELFADPAFRSSIVRTVPEDAGSRILRDPGGAVTDWLRTRLAGLTVLYQASAAVAHIADVGELLGRILELILPAADADRGCVLLTDADTGELMPAAARTADGGAGPVPVSRTVIDHVMREREGILASDAQADDRFRDGESIRRHDLRDVICVPMRGRHQTVGALFLAGRGRFTDDHLQLAVAVAHLAAVAVEEARQYQALLAAERLAAVGQTIAALSHHIKNIMHGVRFGGDMVRTALAEDDRDLLAKGWKLVEKNQARIDDLIQDMLSYSKDREPAAEPTDLGKLAADVLDIVRGRAAERGIELTFDPPAGLVVSCDPDGVHKALLNVVSNALDAVEGRESPRVSVTIGTTADGRFAEIAVADNGPGVPADAADDIFRPFVSTKGSRGTGLGLPVSRKILREHGGELAVEPAAGGGSRFVLRLPASYSV